MYRKEKIPGRLIYELKDQFVYGIGISAFLQKSVLQVDQRIDYEALLIICESDFRIEHLPHLHFIIIV